MPLVRYDLEARNNADWSWALTAYEAPGNAAPWANVAPWQPATSYSAELPASVVTFDGDLYVASGSGSWTSGDTFGAETTRWTKVGNGGAYAGTPLDLTGAVIKMTLARVNPSTLEISVPRRPVTTLTSDGSDGNEPTIIAAAPSNGQMVISLPKARGALVPGGVYGYDINFYKDNTVSTLFVGVVTVTQGANP